MRLSDIMTVFSGQSSSKPILAGEAHAIWNFLNMRYLYREMTEIFKNYIEDTEFGIMVKKSIYTTLDEQIKKTEEILKFYEIVVPPQPPKGINTPVNSETIRDEMMYRILLVGIQYFIETHAETLRMMNNDSLRNLFMGWMHDEMKIFDDLVKYGKVKGWYWDAPSYRQ